LAEKPVASGYIVDRVVICDAFREPDRHYQLLPGGKSKLTLGRRPSMCFRATAKDTKGGIDGIIGKEAALFEEMTAAAEEKNEVVIQLRNEVRAWREAGYPGTSLVTRRCLEWWFERDEERFKQGKRFFFCQQEAIEALIYLYEVQRQRKMPETGEFIRYALKLATGTGKTLVMALIVVWSTLHKQKVSGSPLSSNFLVLVPNLTVRDRVRGVDQLTNQPTGSGLDPRSPENLYDEFEIGKGFHWRQSETIGLLKMISHRKADLCLRLSYGRCSAAASRTQLGRCAAFLEVGATLLSSMTRRITSMEKSVSEKGKNLSILSGAKFSTASVELQKLVWWSIFPLRLGMGRAHLNQRALSLNG
jgi:hypothetical protein